MRRREHPFPPPPLQPLLLWQGMGLLWLCGLLAGHWLEGALTAAAVILWADTRLRRPGALLAALMVFGLGWGACLWLMPQRPTVLPPWAQTNPHARQQVEGRVQERLDGRVERVQGLPDGRWRIILDDVRPAAPDGSGPRADAPPLPGKVAWTWDRGTGEAQEGRSQTSSPNEAPPSENAAASPTATLLPALPLEGQRVSVRLPLRTAEGFRNPGQDAFGPSGESQGIFWRLWSRGQTGQPQSYGDPAWGAAARRQLRENLLTALAGTSDRPSLTQGQAFLPALLFGDRSFLHQRSMEHMAQASLAHSLALSGQHLALAALLGALLARLLGSIHPRLYLRLPRPKLLRWAGLSPALIYLWMGGAPASLLRAFCMLLLLTLLLWKNRVAPLSDVLLAAVCGITLFWPMGVFDTGLQLSALCVGALALTLPLIRRIPLPARHASHRKLRLFLRRLAQAFCVSLAIQLALLPFSLVIFGFVSPWFALNVLWLPVLGLWVLPLGALGLLLATAGFLLPAHGALWLAALPCDALLTGLNMLAHNGAFALPALLRPHWTALIGWAALLAALALLAGRKRLPAAGRKLALAGVLLLLIGPTLRLAAPWTAPLRLTLLDVGQGQAVALSLPGGERLLVDGGGSGSPRFDPGRALVAPALAHNHAPRLHAVIASHPDADHMGGLAYILRTFNVEHFLHNGEQPRVHDLRALLESYPGQPLHAGMVVNLPSSAHPPLRLEVLHPPQEQLFTGNAHSLILRLVQGETGLVLLPGDAEHAALRHVLAAGQDLRAQVLVLPHHGSRGSLVPEFYDAVKPRLALASCGRDNRFGYPAPEVTRALAERGIPLRVTAREGYVELRWDGKGTLLEP